MTAILDGYCHPIVSATYHGIQAETIKRQKIKNLNYSLSMTP